MSTPARRSGRIKRIRDRASAEGTVWVSSKDRFVPAGRLLDLSDTGMRYRHDPASLDPEGFPLAAPEAGQAMVVAITHKSGDVLRAIHAHAIRVTKNSEGQIEVGCLFDATDSGEMREVHKQYVNASLSKARLSLSSMRAKLFNQPDPARRARKPIGQILVERKAVHKADLEAFLHGNRSGVPLGTRLLKAGLVTTRQLAEALAQHTGVPFVDLDAVGVTDDALRRIKPSVAMKSNVVAFAMSSRRLKVACERPLTIEERTDLEAQTRVKVQPHIADAEQIERILHGPAKPQRTKRKAPGQAILVRYRFYGPTMQQLDPRTFEGAAANLSETGMLLGGPAPERIVSEFRKLPPPRMFIAAQIFPSPEAEPVTLRFEPVRISPVSMPNRIEAPYGDPAPTCWIGARISSVLPEDRQNLSMLCELIR